MKRTQLRKLRDKGILARVTKEMAQPRLAKSVRKKEPPKKKG